MSGHTPGPWQVVDNTFFYEIRTCSEACEQIGDVCSSKFWNDGKHARSNANLIAAAPDLLAACQGAMQIVSLWNGREVPEDHEHAEEMKALHMMQEAFIEAIAKAEGKSK